jgi:enoyl-[acyl-carrier protein] reductase III
MNDPLDLTGRRVLVTGGSRGIGAVLSRTLAARGAHVGVNYAQDDAAAARTVEEIRAAGGSAETLRANLVRPEEIRDLVARAAAGGRLDVVVHNAAIGSFKKLMNLRANQWDLSLGVNARALLHLAQEAAPHLEKTSGCLVGVSSLGGSRVIPEYGAIGVSKAALESLVRSLAVELSPRGIRVNAVSAGLIDVPSVRLHPRYDELERRSVERAGRLGTADDVANVVLFLVSPLAAWITGQTVIADGGMSLPL